MIFLGVDFTLHVKKKKRGGLKFLRSERGGGKKFTMNFLHQAPPASVCEWSLSTYWGILFMEDFAVNK